eukprot:TRINITY_DN8883_c0_g1_i1.p1 TRINITY_DN8883_c0_g1~~TRINITY_DN8883_c0_g1_i1.p1  ORF type:complete len:346 (+),score=26.59 TRINITY_DN8883_c0_g1_i1:161-1198(+)
MALAQALLSLNISRMVHPFSIAASTELLSDDSLQSLEQMLGNERIRKFEHAAITIKGDDAADQFAVHNPQPRHEQLGIAVLQLFLRKCRRDAQSARSANLHFQYCIQPLSINIECAHLAPPLLDIITSAQRKNLFIHCLLDGQSRTSMRASALQPECVSLVRSDRTPSGQLESNMQPFFDAPSHVLKQMIVSGLSSEYQLPALRVRSLIVHSGSLSLRPGSTVYQYDASSDDGETDMTGSSCFCISVRHRRNNNDEWTGLRSLSDSIRCTKLKLTAAMWQTFTTLPDHPILQHVRLLELYSYMPSLELPDNYAELLDRLLGKIPDWLMHGTIGQPTAATFLSSGS